MSERRTPWTRPQREALAELRRLRDGHPEKILKVSQPYRPDLGQSAAMLVDVCLSMSVIDRPADDTLLDDHEGITIIVGDRYPERPPKVCVGHNRFVDVVHVLYGRELCIYLNEDREWHPAGGMADVLEQVWKLLEDAANKRFDPKAALFHPIGGLNPVTPGTGAAVVRSFPGTPGKPLSLGDVRNRTDSRIDLGRRHEFCGSGARQALTISVPGRLPFGPGHTLSKLLDNVAGAGGPSREAVLGALQRTATSDTDGEPIVLTLAVCRGETPLDGWHLCTASLLVTESARAQVAAATTSTGIEAAIGPGAELQWFDMPDQRPELAVRRDAQRPTNAFVGRDVEVWGCGALGSWIAELLVRAGVARIWLTDNRAVGAGLMVRQNFVENDVGFAKASALKSRLEAISDTVIVEATVGTAALSRSERASDLIIDATVNEAVAAFQTLRKADRVIASVATDVESASLGLLAVGSSAFTPSQVQDVLSTEVLKRGDLEPFHRFWSDIEPSRMVVPAPGCSTPTFHGSAADAMGLASTMVNLIGNHLSAEAPGLHLINMPHSGLDAPGHVFLEMAS